MIRVRCVVKNDQLATAIQLTDWIVAKADELDVAHMYLPAKKLIFTSKHAVQFFVQRFRPSLQTHIVAVGESTAQLLTEQGFTNVTFQDTGEGLKAALQLVPKRDDCQYQIITALNGTTLQTLERLSRNIQTLPIYKLTPYFTSLDKLARLGLFDKTTPYVFDVRSGLLFEYTITHLMREFNVTNPNLLPKNIFLKCPKLSALQKCHALDLLDRLVI